MAATYATVADYKAYIEGAPGVDDARIGRELVRAERDVDRVLGPMRRDDTTGLKVDPTQLPPYMAAALSRAVCAQAVFLITSAPAVGSAPGAVVLEEQGPEFRIKYATPAVAGTGGAAAVTGRLAPAVADELEPLSFLRPRGARARA